MPRIGGTFRDPSDFALARLRAAAGRRHAGRLHADWDFSLISRRAQALYGPLGEGQQRIDAWQQLLATQKQIGELEQLNVVNRFFNKQMRYEEDIDLWHEVDYWENADRRLVERRRRLRRLRLSPSISACAISVSPVTSCASPTSRLCA